MAKEEAIRLWLVPLSEELQPVELPQCESVTSIGRNPTNDIVLPKAYAYASRDHFRIRSNLANLSGPIWLEDLSANGTYVNGRRVGKGFSKRLKCGDEISLAKPHRRGGALHFQLAKLISRMSKL